MHTRQHHDLAFAHHQHAQLHRHHAEAHHQQAMFHQQQAAFHQNQLHSLTGRSSNAQGPFAYNEKNTAFNNQVSQAALVFHGHVSPQSMQSLNQYQNPYPGTGNPPVSSPYRHATDNTNATHRGTKF